MDFLRRHVFFLACGIAGLGGIALAVTGLSAMPRVIEQMEDVEQLYRDLSSLESRPVNMAVIDAESERIQRIREDYNRVVAKAAELYGYTPLVENIFPDGDNNARFEFLKRYNTAMDQLMESLSAGRVATDADVNLAADKIEEERLRSTPLGLDQGATESESEPGGEPFTPAGVLTKAGARLDPEARAAMAVAQVMDCYAISHGTARAGEVPSLEFFETLEDTGKLEPPYIEDCWWAQIAYWIQRDVIDAIVAVNEEATAAARQRGEDRWVGIMPVKDVISIRLSGGYITASEEEFIGAPSGGYSEALPCGTANTVFTESVSTRSYDVIQFTVKLVMDQRDIMTLIDRICKNRFHTLLRVAYKAVPPNRKMRGKIYGSEPTVNVVLDFETIMLGSVFRPLMPQAVCEANGIDCPKPETPEEDGD